MRAEGAGPLSRVGEGQGEGCDFSGEPWSLTPTLSRTGEGVHRGLPQPWCLKPVSPVALAGRSRSWCRMRRGGPV
ncbi:hypothetical protein FV233_09415 [Methylobacterium sp. WL7]|nr:hypothetical protein FV233_09415 [Methylobacterium sp. WL7]